MIEDLYKVNRVSTWSNHHDDELSNANTNPLIDLLKRAEHKYHFRAEEVGMTHPLQRGTVKIRNNGSVDTFAEEENGTRFDTQEQVSNDFANDKKAHLFSETEWLTGDSASYVRGHRTMKTEGKTYLYGRKNITLEGQDNLNIYVHNKWNKDNKIYIVGNVDIEVHGNVDAEIRGHLEAKIQQHATIESDGPMKLKSNKHLHLIAPRIDYN